MKQASPLCDLLFGIGNQVISDAAAKKLHLKSEFTKYWKTQLQPIMMHYCKHGACVCNASFN